MAGAAFLDPRCADFVEGTALGDPRRADFVAGTALGALWEPQSAHIVASTALFTGHSCLSKSWKCISNAPARRIWGLRSRCGDFSWEAQGKPRVLVLQSRRFVTGARDRTCFTWKYSFVAGAALWTWW